MNAILPLVLFIMIVAVAVIAFHMLGRRDALGDALS